MATASVGGTRRLVHTVLRGIVVLALLGVPAALAQLGTLTTVAGAGVGDGLQAAVARINRPQGVAVDAAGNVFIADTADHRIRKVSPGGVISTVAGTGFAGYAGDGGPALQALLSSPTQVAVDAAGNLFILETESSRIRKVSAGGVITTFAGTGTEGFSGDGGLATAAQLNRPGQLAADSQGNLLIADTLNNRIRRVSAAGLITTIAGDGTPGPSFAPPSACGDGGPATAAKLAGPRGVAVDGGGNLYVTTLFHVWKVDASGTITALAGTGAIGFSGDGGPALLATFYGPEAIAVDGAGNVYVSDTVNVRVRKVAAGIVTTVAGNGTFGTPAGDGGPATAARLEGVKGIAADAAGNLYLAIAAYSVVRRVDTAGTISRFAGTAGGEYIGDGGSALAASLEWARGLAVDGEGNLYLSQVGLAGSRVRKVTAGGMIDTIAGTSAQGFSGDGGPAVNATLSYPTAIALDDSASPTFIDAGNRRVRRIDGAGNIATVAGDGGNTPSGDGGPATTAAVGYVDDVARDSAGNLYLADAIYGRVRKVTPGGIITTRAGTGVAGDGADGAPAALTPLTPLALAVDADGALHIASAHRIRKIDESGNVVSVAGTGEPCVPPAPDTCGDGGPATAATFLTPPRSITFDDAGNLYVADGNFIRRVAPNGLIERIAGSGTATTDGEGGQALAARLIAPSRLAADSSGGLHFIDADGEPGRPARIRRIAIADASPVAFSFAPVAAAAVGVPVQSGAVTPTGYDAPARVQVSGGEYSIGCTGTFVSGVGTLAPGQSICVRHTAAGAANASVTTRLAVGRVSADFVSTTATGPGSIGISPASLDFGALSMNTTSPPQTLTLANTGAVPVTVNAVVAPSSVAVTHGCATLAPAATCEATVTLTPATQGAIVTTIAFQNSPGTQSVAVTGTGERSLATHYYRAILGRAPDAAGKSFWDAEALRLQGLGVNVNEAWYAMATYFYFSPEYQSFHRDDAGFMSDLYRTFFNRPADAGGLAFWTGQLAAGMPREVVLVSFMFSPEFRVFTQGIFGAVQARKDVDTVVDFYRGLLARLPEDDGFANWLGQFRLARCRGAGAVYAAVAAISGSFAEGTEYTGRNRTNAQYVGDLYNAFLRRGGDLEGVQFWIDQLATGAGSRAQLRQGFISSAEFNSRVQALMAESCLP